MTDRLVEISLLHALFLSAGSGCAVWWKGSACLVVCSSRSYPKPSHAGCAGGGGSGQLHAASTSSVPGPDADMAGQVVRTKPSGSHAPFFFLEVEEGGGANRHTERETQREELSDQMLVAILGRSDPPLWDELLSTAWNFLYDGLARLPVLLTGLHLGILCQVAYVAAFFDLTISWLLFPFETLDLWKIGSLRVLLVDWGSRHTYIHLYSYKVCYASDSRAAAVLLNASEWQVDFPILFLPFSPPSLVWCHDPRSQREQTLRWVLFPPGMLPWLSLRSCRRIPCCAATALCSPATDTVSRRREGLFVTFPAASR